MSDKIHITPPSIPSESEQVSKKVDLDGLFDNNFDIPGSMKATMGIRDKESKGDPSIKNNDWEQVKRTTAMETVPNEMDLRAVQPSRAANEHNMGGTGLLPGVGNTLAEPDLLRKQKNNELTEAVLKDAQEKRDAQENRGKPTQESRDEWEQVTPAKTTNDVPAGQMGFTPHKTSYVAPEVDRVKVPAIEREKEKVKESTRAGVEAAKIKEQLDGIMNETMNKKMGMEWEEEALHDIQENITKEMKPAIEGMNLAPEFTPVPKAASGEQMDLSGLFGDPIKKIEESEVDIRRDSSRLKDPRERRQDDRSWETVEPAKKY